MGDGSSKLATSVRKPEARAETAVVELCKKLLHAHGLQHFCAAWIACLEGTAGATEAPLLSTITHMGPHAIRSLFKTAAVQASIMSHSQAGHTREWQFISSLVFVVISCVAHRGFRQCTSLLAVQTMAFRWEKNEAWRNHPMLTNQLRVACECFHPVPSLRRYSVSSATPHFHTSFLLKATLCCSARLKVGSGSIRSLCNVRHASKWRQEG